MAHPSLTGPRARFQLQLGTRGRLVLPAAVRQRQQLHPGDRLVLIVDESGQMRLVSLRKQIESCMGMFKDVAPRGRLLSEELIAERREEALREDRR